MNLNILNTNTPVELLNQWVKKSLIGNLGIEFTKTELGLVEGFFTLSEKNCRPDGILHGGTNLAMAETLAGLGSMLIVDNQKYDVLGTQISGNHTGVLKEGKAFAKAKIIHQGNKTHIWNVDITAEDNRLISTVRVTNMIVLKND
ncbi:MAG: PaaI family thioesterase [Prolixibacteraceae bacterium]|nr:PaaI family thioesterase [Prolixibacteraceae bacterium]